MSTIANGRPAIFLDRDGVLVVPEFREGRSFAPRRIEDYHFYPDALSALRRLKAADYFLVVVTNQPDVGKGLIELAVVEEMHRRLMATLPVDLVKMCPHTKEHACACRKPRPGMLIEAARELGISLTDSYMIGDRTSDVEAGRAAGCWTVFINLGYAEPQPIGPTYVVRSLAQATDVILTAPTALAARSWVTD